jgi:hypothetical protein
MHAGRAGGHHHPIQIVILYGLNNALLPWLRTGIQGICGINHIRIGLGSFRYLGYIHSAGDIASAMTYEYAESHWVLLLSGLPLANLNLFCTLGQKGLPGFVHPPYPAMYTSMGYLTDLFF